MDEQAILAGGCFWCIEAIFKDIIGIISVESGYIGGTVPNPSYEQVCEGKTGHAEAVRLVFDSSQISYADILDIFFDIHDPTQLNRQGDDVGIQYRSAIFPLNNEQEHLAQDAIVKAQAHTQKPIVTKIEPASVFYPAEAYHQDYFYQKGSGNNYCALVVAPKIAKFRKSYRDKLKQ
ncbi:MAG: peptide-methionine (S)-S-oxide reductase MsrA [Zymomonas mobilis]|uniref:Peptide methionine sulfoxide reductase MsrA n=1 Tax=Zymomonas mobilis TaxID=542 RepID=A0A542W1H9_ZYMMB|nr:peptide-methionine (S)-S-oxide reductase MsrA [Zymomonas mobilis]TQL17399.1 peptide-methionine (S)-S-oxide reductase [Zymomonas mobilis]